MTSKKDCDNCLEMWRKLHGNLAEENENLRKENELLKKRLARRKKKK